LNNQNFIMQLIQSLPFAAHVESLLQRHHVPGLSVAVFSNGTISSNGFGFASLDPPRKCTADTLFNIASASKSLTAASVGFLVNNDDFPQVQYNATLSSLLPDDFVMSEKEYTDNVTVEDALGHRTGLPR
jgi:CubicO group peptidase (beta-lactamase class C family)